MYFENPSLSSLVLVVAAYKNTLKLQFRVTVGLSSGRAVFLMKPDQGMVAVHDRNDQWTQMAKS